MPNTNHVGSHVWEPASVCPHPLSVNPILSGTIATQEGHNELKSKVQKQTKVYLQIPKHFVRAHGEITTTGNGAAIAGPDNAKKFGLVINT